VQFVPRGTGSYEPDTPLIFPAVEYAVRTGRQRGGVSHVPPLPPKRQLSVNPPSSLCGNGGSGASPHMVADGKRMLGQMRVFPFKNIFLIFPRSLRKPCRSKSEEGRRIWDKHAVLAFALWKQPIQPFLRGALARTSRNSSPSPEEDMEGVSTPTAGTPTALESVDHPPVQ